MVLSELEPDKVAKELVALELREADTEGEVDMDASVEGLLMEEALGLGVEVNREETDAEADVGPLKLVDTLPLLVTTEENEGALEEVTLTLVDCEAVPLPD